MRLIIRVLKSLTVQVYYKADFSRAVTLKLQDELAKGPRAIRIEDLFGPMMRVSA